MARFTGKQINMAIGHLIASDGLRLPHGIWPDQTESGRQLREAEWDEVEWNPPGLWKHIHRFSAADPDASPKPSSGEMQAALDVAALAGLRQATIAALRAECRRRVTLAYAAGDWQSEVETRLRGEQTAEQDTERDRLRAVFATLQTSIAAMTLDQLRAFDPTDDAIWEEPDA